MDVSLLSGESAAAVTPGVLLEIARQVASQFDPEKVILFGSRAWGVPHLHSDVDLLVVVDTEVPATEMEARIALTCRPRFVPMDVLVRTPKEVEDRLALGDSLIRRILEEGRVLYERSPGTGVAQQS